MDENHPSHDLSTTHALGLMPEAVRRDLRREKRLDFTQTRTFQAIRSLCKSRFGLGPPFSRLPEIRLASVKIDRALTMGWFARQVEGRYLRCRTRAAR